MATVLEEQLNERIRGHVELDSVEWALSDLPKAITGGWIEVTIEGLQVRDVGRDGELVLRIPRAHAEIDAHSLMFGNHDVVIRTARVPAGDNYALIKEVPEPFPLHEYDRWVVSLIAAFYPKQRDGFRAGLQAFSAPVYDIRHIELGGADLEFEFPAFSAEVHEARGTGFFYSDMGDPLSPKMYYSLGSEEAPLRSDRAEVHVGQVQLEARDVEMTRLEQMPTGWPRDAMAETVRWEAEARTAEGARVHTEGAMIDYWTDFFGGDYDVVLDVNEAGGEATRLSDGLASGDDLSLRVDVTGSSLAPRVKLQVTGLDVAVPVGEQDEPLDLHLERAAGAFDLATNSGYLEDTVARGAGGKVQVSANFSIDPYRFDLYARIPEALELRPYLPPDLANLAGTELRGKLHAFGTNQTQELDDLELYLGAASLRGKLVREEDGRIHADTLHVRLGDTDIHARGVVDLVAEKFDLWMRYVSGDLQRWLRYYRAPPVATRLDGTARLTGTFDAPTATASMTAEGVPILDRVAAELGYSDLVLTLRQATSTPMDGQVRASGRIRLGPRPHVLGLDARAERLDLSRAPVIGPLLGGRLNARASARGPVDRLDAEARAAVDDLTIADDGYRDARLEASTDPDGSRRVSLVLERDSGGVLDVDARVDPAGRLGGTIDLRQIRLDQLASLEDAEDPYVGGTLDTSLRLSGTPSAPIIEGDTRVVGAWIGDAFLGPAHLRFEPAGEATVAVSGSLLQGRLGVEATVQTRPPYAVEAELTFDRIELDQLMPELAAAYGARAWVSGSLRVDTSLQETADRPLEAELYISEATVLMDNEDSSGRPAPLRVRNLSPVHLTFDGTTARLIEPAVLEGPGGTFTLSGSGSTEELAARLEGNLSMAMLEPYLRDDFDDLSGVLAVNIDVSGPITSPRLDAVVDIEDLAVRPARKDAVLSIPSGRVAIDNEQLSLTGVTVYMNDRDTGERAELDVSGGLRLQDFEPALWAVQIDGQLAGKMLLVAAPRAFSQASGTADLTVALLGPGGSPKIDGSIAFDTERPLTLTPRGLRREIAFTGGELRFTDQLVEFTGIRGTVDDEGRVHGVDGEISLRDWRPVDADLTLSADNLPFRVPKTLDMNLGVEELRIVGGGDDLYIGGNIEVIDGRYIQDFNLAQQVIEPARAGGGGEPFYEDVPWLANADINVSIETRSFSVQNNLAPKIEMAGGVRLTGTPSNPRFDGEISVEQGTFKIPGMRAAFTRTNGTVSFTRFKQFPEETPVLKIDSEADYRDSSGQDHLITLVIEGPLSNLDWDLFTSTGLNKGQTLQLLLSGKTPEELRSALGDDAVARDPTKTERTATQDNVYDQIVKDVAGDFLSLLIEDRLRHITSLDVARVEIGTGSIGVRGEKNFLKNLRAKGEYEVSVRGWTVDARGELRVDDATSVEIRYLNQELNDDSEEDREDFRLQLIWRFPLIP